MTRRKSKTRRSSGSVAAARAGDIAVIGLGGRFPQARNPDELWINVLNGRSAVTAAPEQRSQLVERADEPIWGAFIDDVDCFDASFFAISPKEAQLMDPQQRLLLEVVWHTLEDARIKPSAVAGSKTGVFIGACNVDYGELIDARTVDAGMFSTTGVFASILANRISYAFDWRGPSLTVDTACSSSLVAVHLASKALQAGECELAIAGGVNVCWTQRRFVAFSDAGMLSRDGRCRTFDAGANGYVRGEGVGAVLLKPLEHAVRDGNRIYGVIKGSAVNHGGKNRGLTVVSPAQQAQLLMDAYRAAGIRCEEVGYIEAHAIGSALADPIEFLAIKQAFRVPSAPPERDTSSTKYCALGSVKANIGHLEAAAGIGSLVKVLLMLKHKVIPPCAGLSSLNPLIKLEDSPFYIPTSDSPWSTPPAVPRVAGVSSFGFGGACAHVVVAEHVQASPPRYAAPSSEPQLIVLSARDADRLRAWAGSLLEWLRSSESGARVRLEELAYALQTHREALEERLALVAPSVEALIAALEVVVRGERPAWSFRGRVAKGKKSALEDSSANVEANGLDRCAERWVQGAAIDWSRLHLGRSLRPIDLPLYPFAKQRYWVDANPVTPAPAAKNHDVRRYIEDFLSRSLALPPSSIERDKDLQELGVDSLLERRLTQGLARTFGASLQTSDMAARPSVDALIELVERQSSSADKRPQTSRASSGTARELSEVQKGLWTLQRMSPASSAYNIPFAVRCSGAFDSRAFAQAHEWLLSTHPLLRSVVVEVAGSLHFHDRGAHSVPIIEERVAGLSPPDLHDRVYREARIPFDLAKGPLLRVSAWSSPAQTLLLFVVHHIIFDARSLEVLLADLVDAYARIVRGRPLAEEPLAASWDDFVTLERAALAQGQSHLEYWRKQLSGPLPVLELPIDRPRGSGDTERAETHSWKLDASRSSAIRHFCRERRINPPALFLAAWQLLLSRYTRETDVIVGVPAYGRPDERFDDLIGCFINMVAVRTDVDEEKTLGVFLQGMQATLSAGLDHAAYPFPSLVRDLKLARNGASPVFQMAFEYRNASLRSFDWQRASTDTGLKLEPVEGLHQQGEYECVLEVLEQADAFAVNLKYDAQLFATHSIGRIAMGYTQLMDELLSRPDSRLREYSLLSDAETRQLLLDWNATEQLYPKSACVHDLFEQQALRSPDAVAVSCDGASMTYRELHDRSDTFARFLQQQGAADGSLVALCIERSTRMMVALLGILKAGAAYVPLDPDYPAERLSYMVQDSQAKLIVTQTSLLSRLRALQNGAALIAIDTQWHEITSVAADRALRRTDGAQHLAYVIYTSGSTGQPKGVMIPHQALTNFLLAVQPTAALKGGDSLLAVTTLSFDIAGLELYLPLLSGAACAIATARESRDVQQLSQLLQRLRPALMQATPATWNMLFQAGWRNAERVRIFCGGEALPPKLREQFIASGSEAWNLFGPTETTIWSTMAPIVANAPVTIGKPLANTQIYIVDRYRKLTPMGVPGELCIAGDGLARGYLNRAELTARKFTDNPFRPGTRLYCTGDLARWTRDGTIEYLGRMDEQVKVRGYRIELGEIEHAVRGYPMIRDAAAVVSDQVGHPQLIVYYTVQSQGAMQASALRDHLRRTLPDYMVPTRLIEMAMLPLTPNGKLDRKSLSRRELAPEVTDAAAVAVAVVSSKVVSSQPRAVEQQVLSIWRELLKNDAVGVEEGFFDAGGDSLLAVVVAARIEQDFNCSFPAASIFRYPTVRSISAHLGATTRPAGLSVARGDEVTSTGGLPDYYERSVAVIGISCHFPGAADHHAFWENLRRGVESIEIVTHDELGARDASYVSARAALDGKDLFDAEFFRIPPRDAQVMDPQMRQLLMHSWKAVEDAGYVPRRLPKTGVFMSASTNFYQAPSWPSGSAIAQDADQYVSWVLAQSGTIPTLISHKLGLTGPSLFVHSNCSSSLVALHAAYQSLTRGEATCALVGAATLFPTPTHGYRHQPGMNFSSDGHLRAFDADADGMIGSEGVAVLLLKQAKAALADGDHIYALLRGVGVNNDGAAKAGFYAPSVEGQAAVIEQVLETTGVHPESIEYIEAHGTGTKLGDPVEFAALRQVYERRTNRKQFCGLGSVKTNVGHLDTAAGLAGCIKVALCLEQGELPASLHFKRANAAIRFADSPFYVVAQSMKWPAGSAPRRAAISSFGIGGTNTHAIFEQAPALSAEPAIPGPCIVPLSARNSERLRAHARRLLDFLARSETVDLAAVAYTLQVGREAMNSRVAFVVSSLEDLAAQLLEFLNGRQDVKYLEGEVSADAAELRDLQGLGELWMKGAAIEWSSLYAERQPRRISLPTYPFAPERHWLETAATVAKGGAAGALHPLLHRNTSTLRRPRFSSVFDGDEFFFADHVIHGRRVLPGVAYLEMIRAAVAQATDSPPDVATMRFKNVVWISPIVVAAVPAEFHVELTENSRGAMDFKVYSLSEDPEETLHAQGAVELVAFDSVRADLQEELEHSAIRDISPEQCYGYFLAGGTVYGDRLRGLKQIRAGEGRALVELQLPGSIRASAENFVLHPSLLDSAIQATLYFGHRAEDGLIVDAERPEPTLPFSVDEVEVHGRCPERMWATVRYSDRSSGAALAKLDIDLVDAAGNVCVRLRNFSRRAFDPVTSDRSELMLCRPAWIEHGPASEDSVRAFEHHVLLCDLGDEGERLAEQLLATPSALRCRTLRSDARGTAEQFRDYASQLFGFIQERLHARPTDEVLVQVLVPADPRVHGLGGLSGLLKTAEREHSKLVCQLLAIERGVASSEVAELLLVCARSRQQKVLELRRGKLWQLSWERIPERNAPLARPWKNDGIYLITGGAGALGRLLASEIVSGAPTATVILAGRTHLSETALRDLRASGSNVAFMPLDVVDRAAVENAIQAIQRDYGALNGVIHCAGTLRDNYIINKPSAELADVLAPKVDGLVNLDEATAELPLDFFVAFASISGALGNAGQADYAAANAFMDDYLRYRDTLRRIGQRHGRSVAFDWPLWRDGGMQVDAESARLMSNNTGIVPMSTRVALDAFYRGLDTADPQVLVLHGDLARMQQRGIARMHVEPRVVNTDAAPAETAQETSDRSAAMLEKIRNLVTRSAAAVLKMSPGQLELDAELSKFGFDSVSFVALVNALNRELELDLTPTVFFEYPTIGRFAEYLGKEYPDRFSEAPAPVARAPVKATTSPPIAARIAPVIVRSAPQPIVDKPADPGELPPVAIVGMSGVFPQAEDVQEFWRNLLEGRDCISEVPPSRWDWRALWGDPRKEPNKSNVKWGGFVPGLEEFDPLFFGISPREAESMDPQQRLLMSAAWHAIEDAGYSAQSLSGSNMGVFVGIGTDDYSHRVADAQLPLEGFSATGTACSLGANRLSFLLDVHGPSEAIDTACSSSLVAIHRAHLAIASGTCDTALVGGVNAIVMPRLHVSFNKAGMLSEDGRCKTFSSQANGYVRGEGVGLLLLKKLSDAERDGDHIYAVIRGSAENHGGRANSLTAPNPKAQAALLRAAYERSGIDARTVTYIEAHGTGTELGDPIEIEGLKSAFDALYDKSSGNSRVMVGGERCGIGSVKSNIGHLELAAGVAGVIKVVLQMKHRMLVKSLHSEPLNPYIRLEGSPFHIVTENQPWTAPLDVSGTSLPRRAGVSSFGFGGSNAHVVIEEYVAHELEAARGKRAPVAIVLSAKDGERLKEQAMQLLQAIEAKHYSEDDLESLAYTLQMGRDAMDSRLGFVAKSLADIAEKLRAAIDDSTSDGVHRGQAKRDRETLGVLADDADLKDAIARWVEWGKLDQVIGLWVKGFEFNWRRMYGDRPPRRMSLPTYPFARKRCWIDLTAPVQTVPSRRTDVAPELRPVVTLAALPDVSSAPPAIAAAPTVETVALLTSLPIAAGDLESELRTTLAEVLHMSPSEIERDSKFVDIGLDSITGVEWTQRLAERFAVPIKATQVYDHPSLGAFARFIAGALAARAVAPQPAPRAQVMDSVEISVELPVPLPVPAENAIHIYREPAVEEGQAVVLTALGDGVVRITMQDRVGKNTFTPELVRGLSDAFAAVRNDPDCKVVILTGYDTYFCCGGSREGLLAIQRGDVKFTDVDIYTLALECQVPVIAAMQGHAIGAGWALGMFSDFVVMSRESTYTSNYMSYGFTPGAGATLIFPEKLGLPLAQEILFTATRYSGEELEKKGVPFPILPRDEVVTHAIQLARKLAESPRPALIALKELMSSPLREKVASTLAHEQAQHDKTFVNQPEVRARIENVFGGRQEADTEETNAVAIVGMAGQFPKADSLQVFWENLRDGVDCIGEVPASRWAIEDYYDADPDAPGKTRCKWLGSLERADEFDPLFFNIPPASAVQMDPQQRLFLQNCWHCIEDAGIEPASLSGSRCGVYVGCVSGDYSNLLKEHGLTAHGFMGGSNAILAARISYLLNLKGLSVALDTSCSSSLVAVAQACDSLVSGANDVALAGGVFVLAGPGTHIMTSQSGMLSADGRCFSFDHRANGFVPGEGVGVLLLKRLSDARRDGDPIHAVLRGWGVNQDGSTNGITAPSADSQSELESDVYRRFGIDPRTISLVEAHGTGTPLGDPIEVEALMRSFGRSGTDSPHCALGSVKSNVGHLVAAAGIAGVIKAVLALEHRQLPPTINFERLNPHIDLGASPFYINTELRPWVAEAGTPRRSCVSSFGFSGTNAHVVVDEYAGDVDAPAAHSGPVIIALSAKTKSSLREGAARLRAFVARADDIDLAAIAYTLQVGRAAFPERLAFVASSRAELLNELDSYIEAEQIAADDTRRSPSIDPGELVVALEAWRERSDATRLLKYWIGGAQVDWRQLYEGQARPRRVHLPGYAFARQSYWLPKLPRTAIRSDASSGTADPVRLPVAVSTGRRTCFLHKQWIAANRAIGNGAAKGDIAILTTGSTRGLAIALARRFKSASVLDPSRLAELGDSDRYGGVIDLIGCGDTSVEWQHWLQPMRNLVARRHRLGLSLLCVSCGLETLQNGAVNLSGADRVGLYRMLQLEYRQVRSRHVDLDASTDILQAVEQIAAEYEAEHEHVEICYRKGGRYAARLAEIDQRPTPHRGFEFPADRVLWITGGTRGLGMLCARHFVRHHGVKKLVLTGREVLPPRNEWGPYRKQHSESSIARKIGAIEELESLGARVEVASLALTDSAALASYLQQIKRSLGAIGGVLHCAGSAGLDDPAFIHKSQHGAAEVMEPKIGGLNALLDAFASERPKFFVLFSSVAAIVPKLAAGHSDYALANAYMDYVAQARPHGLPLVSIQWPSWQQTGIGEAATAAYRDSGLLSLSDEEGLALLDTALASHIGPVILPAIVDDARWRAEDWMKVPSAVVTVDASAVDTLRDRTQAWLADLFADVLKIPRAELDVNDSFGDYGVDSILLTQLLRRIGRQLQAELDPASPYEHASLAAFTDWLIGKHERSLRAHLPGDTGSIPDKRTVAAPIHSSATFSTGREHRAQDIAVVGMSCRFPGAGNVDAYWDLLVHGRVAISPVPAERWGYQSSYVAGLLPDIYHFDPGHFFIRPEDASAMDPQALLVLEESLRLCHAAGYEPDALKGQSVGVYLGARSQHQPADHSLDLMTNPVLALGQNYLAANVSRFFDLHGPSVVIDTACSSSLVAMQMAVQALQSGEIAGAIVGGVNVLTSDVPHQLFQRRGLLSRSGEFHTFDRRASGVVLGEGVGLVMLKTLEQALRDGDDIQAVVKGIAVNNDGRTAGPATPNISAQRAVMQRALALSGVEPAQVSYIEANASGSEVTDLLELKAIDAVYAGTQRALGSVKPNIGHALCAEGIAAFIKVVLMLKHGRIAPFLSGEHPLEHHDWNASSVRVVRAGSDWQGESRVGAVNCFADGGTNAHVIVQSWHEESARNKRLPLSAPSLQRRDVRTASSRQHDVSEVAASVSSWWERDSVELPQEV